MLKEGAGMNATEMKVRLPKNWSVARCEDVIDVRDGTHYTPKYVPSGYPFITSKNLKPEGIDFSTASYISEEDHREYSKRSKVNRGDILYVMIGTIGNPVFVDVDIEFSIKNVALFKFAKSPIDGKYFRYLLETAIFTKQIDAEQRGGTQKFVSLTVLRNALIPYPPIEEQRRIAEILDRADAIRRKRQEAIRLTEELLRSAFLEMFGDPVTNPKGWTSGTILNVVTNPSDMRCGPFGTQLKAEEIVSEGIPLIGIENVKGGKFQSAISKHITSSKAKELAAFDVQAGDVLVTRMGTIGHACVVPQDLEEARISYHLFRIRSNPDKCLPGFLASTITWSGTFLRQLERLSHGAIMAGLKTADLKEVRFLIPPIKLQNQYLEVVADTERLLEKQKQRLMNDDNLFDSLLQRAFRGEL